MSKSLSLSTDPALRRQPQQKRGQQRVEKILIAAAEVFAEGGYAAATIQQIANRASTAVGSIYQFFPDKLAIFQALKAEHLRQGEILETNFFDADLYRPLIQIVSEFIDTQANYLDSPIARCIVLQYYLQPISELFTMTDKVPDWESIKIEKHANLYRQRNLNLSQAKSKLLSEVSHNICHSLFLRPLENDEQHRQQLYAEIKDVLYSYLNPHIGDHLLTMRNDIMVVSKVSNVIFVEVVVVSSSIITQREAIL
jgi:AcrR family transcriptional regulator